MKCFFRYQRPVGLSLLFLGVALLRSVAPAAAATITVSVDADSGAGSLRQAISDAETGDTIEIASPVSLTTAQLTIDKNLTLVGIGGRRTIARSALTGTPQFRIFAIGAAVTATLSNLSITNGYLRGADNKGGGIYNAGTLTVTGCAISGNTAFTDQSAVPADGGGIASNAGSLTVTNCIIDGNSGYNGGGIYCLGGSLSVTGSSFSRNQAFQEGGAINANNVPTITSSSFTANSASGGGAIRGFGLKISDCVVTDNTSGASGGGIKSYGTWHVKNCIVSSNTATFGSGGGLQNNNGTLSLTGSRVFGNTARSGGGIENFAGTVTVEGSHIYSNRATWTSGGGLSNFSGRSTLISTTINNNESVYAGGGIGSNPNEFGNLCELTLTNCTISGNIVTGSDPLVHGGGGVYASSTNVSLSSCTVTNNSASNVEAGARNGIWMTQGNTQQTGTLSLYNTIVARNGSGASRGDIYPYGGAMLNRGFNVVGINTRAESQFPAGLPNGTSWVGTAAAPLDPVLGALADNGGFAPTHALYMGSPAIDKGATPLTTDQRGIARPQGGGDDIGAFEAQRVSVFGLVRTSTLVPLAGARVQLSTPSGPVGTPVLTDSSGAYFITGVLPGNYTITTTLSGWSFAPAAQSLLVRYASRAANFVGTRTAAAFSIGGRITNSKGAALVGVPVVLSPPVNGVRSPGITNGAGFYTFANVPAGNYTVLPAQSGLAITPPSRSVTITNANIASQDFVGLNTYLLHGRIATAGGAAVAGVAVQLDFGTVVATNSAGYFVFNDVPEGPHTLTPLKSGLGFSPGRKSVTLAGGNLTNQNFIASTGYQLSGRLANSRGIGIADASVQLDGIFTVVSNGAGYYTFRDVGSGGHTVVATMSGYTFTPSPKTVTINGANIAGQNITGNPNAQ